VRRTIPPRLPSSSQTGLRLRASSGRALPASTRSQSITKRLRRAWPFGAKLHTTLLDHGIDLVCNAGFMRMLTGGFVDRWRDRQLNIHPSLLPSFPGLDTHQRALDAGVMLHGCTVHFVRLEMDSGPIIAQAAVPVLPDDTAATLGGRVLDAEHRIYPLALKLVASGAVRIDGERAYVSGLPPPGNPVTWPRP
jgi:phosphoribosylglycinamide formyltransferase 1